METIFLIILIGLAGGVAVVITSYSIHYTKLYDGRRPLPRSRGPPRRRHRLRRRTWIAARTLISASPFCRLVRTDLMVTTMVLVAKAARCLTRCVRAASRIGWSVCAKLLELSSDAYLTVITSYSIHYTKLYE